MTVAITRRPTGTVTAGITAIHLKADDVAVNESDGDPIVHYMTLTASGQPTLRSQEFSGDGEWNGIIFPAAGSWTATLRESSDDSSEATLAITVS